MAYVAGVANNMTDLLSAIIAACAANGWTQDGSIVSRGDCHMKLTVAGDVLTALVGLGHSGSTITTPAPGATCLRNPTTSRTLTWPMTYHIHVMGDEVYVFCNWGVDFWMQLGFGQSPVPGMPGTGVWAAGVAWTTTSGFIWNQFSSGTLSGAYFASANNNACMGFFQATGSAYGVGVGSCVHHGLPGWSSDSALPQCTNASLLLCAHENPATNSTGQATLAPIQPWIGLPDSKVSIVADLRHARFVRMDNLAPAEVVTIGDQQWKCYPVYRKDASARIDYTQGGTYALQHSGTFGYAVRYDGD